MTAREGSDARFAAVTTVVYGAIGVVLSIFHESWRDEADTWLLAKYETLPGVIHRLAFKGTPALWDLIVHPFARLGAPYFALHLLHVAVASAGAYVLFRYAPFDRRLRLLIAFSYFLGYEYLVIARNYAIGIALLFALAALDRERMRRPVLYGAGLALLVNSSVHMFFVGGILLLVFVIEWVRGDRSRRVAAGLALAVAGIALALWQLWPPAGAAHGGIANQFEPRALRWMIGQAFFPAIRVRAVAWLGGALTLAILWSLRRNARALAILLLSGGALGYLMVFKAVGGLRHYGIFFAVIVFVYWIDRTIEWNERHPAVRLLRIALPLILAVAVVTSGVHWWLELTRPFSGSREMASWITSHGLRERTIAAHQPAPASAVLAYLEKPSLWYPAEGRSGSFMLWNRGYKVAEGVSYEKIASVAAHTDAVLLLNRELPNPGAFGYRLLFSTGEDVFGAPDEVFFLYGRNGTVRPVKPGTAGH